MRPAFVARSTRRAKEALSQRVMSQYRQLQTTLRLRYKDWQSALAKGPRVEARSLEWRVSEVTFFRERGFVHGEIANAPLPVAHVQLVSEDGELIVSTAPHSVHDGVWAFAAQFAGPDPKTVRDAVLRVVFADGTFTDRPGIIHPVLGKDQYHVLTSGFVSDLRASAPDFRVLEIGSRARSGHVRREMLGDVDYVGVDIVDGPNTDVVADAHELSRHFEPESFDAVFSFSTFEHLAMPWKVAVEINKVLKVGGKVLVASHQTFPLHDAPWDFWRFSDSAWRSLFNRSTGFDIVATAMGESASIVAHLLHEATRTLETQPAYIGSAVVAVKVGPTDLAWDVPISVISDQMYPG
jgi:hypothetical protein